MKTARAALGDAAKDDLEWSIKDSSSKSVEGPYATVVASTSAVTLDQAKSSTTSQTGYSGHDDRQKATSKAPLKKRSRLGCLTCRRRKVKCDERTQDGQCGICQRLSFDCTWPDTEEEEVIKRRHIAWACEMCRSRKLACSKESPKCRRCIDDNVACSYRAPSTVPSVESGDGASHKPKKRVLSPNVEAPHKFSPLVDRIIHASRTDQPSLRDYLDVFFDLMYPTVFLSFLHRPTLTASLEGSQASSSLMLCIVCLCLRATTPNATMQDEEALTREARHQVMQELHSPSPGSLAGMLMLYALDMANCRYSSSWMCTGLISRMVVALGITSEPSNTMRWAERESSRRMGFAALLIDRFVAGPIPEMRLLPTSLYTGLHLPCLEEYFLNEVACITPCIQASSTAPFATASPYMSGYAFLVELLLLRSDILVYGRNPKTWTQDPWAVDAPFAMLQQRLDDWFHRLPTDFKRPTLATLSSIFTLHVWYHQCYVALCRITLYGLRETMDPVTLLLSPHDWLAQAQHTCLKHANEMADWCGLVKQLDSNFKVHDPFWPICAYETSRVLLYQPDPGTVISDVGGLYRLIAIVRLLYDSKDVWPITAKCVSDDFTDYTVEYKDVCKLIANSEYAGQVPLAATNISPTGSPPPHEDTDDSDQRLAEYSSLRQTRRRHLVKKNAESQISPVSLGSTSLSSNAFAGTNIENVQLQTQVFEQSTELNFGGDLTSWLFDAASGPNVTQVDPFMGIYENWPGSLDWTMFPTPLE